MQDKRQECKSAVLCGPCCPTLGRVHHVANSLVNGCPSSYGGSQIASSAAVTSHFVGGPRRAVPSSRQQCRSCNDLDEVCFGKEMLLARHVFG